MTKIKKLKKAQNNRPLKVLSRRSYKSSKLKKIKKTGKIEIIINKESNINELLNSLKFIKTNDFLIKGETPKIQNNIQIQNEIQINFSNLPKKKYNPSEPSILLCHSENFSSNSPVIQNKNLGNNSCPSIALEKNFGSFNNNREINHDNMPFFNMNYPAYVFPCFDCINYRNNYNNESSNNNLNNNINYNNINIRNDNSNVSNYNRNDNNINSINNINRDNNNLNTISNDTINNNNNNSILNDNRDNNNTNSIFNNSRNNNNINTIFNDNRSNNNIFSNYSFFDDNFIDTFSLIVNDNNNLSHNRSIKSIKESLLKNKILRKSLLEDNKKNCMICLDEFKLGQNYYTLPCSHVFHVRCFNKEIKIRQKCPICRGNL